MNPSFRTHLNYAKRMEALLEKSDLRVIFGNGQRRTGEMRRFWKLYEVTRKSIDKDVELARGNKSFAFIAAPWLPVKCYYALYYLESIMLHLIDGSLKGFRKGGHKSIRTDYKKLLNRSDIEFTMSELNSTWKLTQVRAMPRIKPGQNARHDYWKKAQCSNSIVKKLMDYVLHDASQNWNLRINKGRQDKQAFISNNSLALIDFFYWYRIKSNYRDLDHIDFESGVTDNEAWDYMGSYYNAFEAYRGLLVKSIRTRFTP